MGNPRNIPGVGGVLNDGKNGVHISRVIDPSRLVAITEFGGWHMVSGYGQDWGHSWHGDSEYSLGFVDGHAINRELFHKEISDVDYSYSLDE